MNNEQLQVWEIEHDIETKASAESIWSLFKDVSGWRQWNAGIEKIEIHGPFEAGTKFLMTPPGQEPITTRLVEVSENAGFVDETRVGDLRIFVDHRIEPMNSGRTRVVFSLEAFGSSCDEIGPQVSADFPEVLKALVSLAECQAE